MFDKLVQKAKLGDKKAIEEIIDRLQPLIISSIRKYYYKKNEYEDLIQDGNIAIIQSILDFDNTKCIHFLGFAKVNLKYLYLNKHKERIHFSLNEPISDGEGEIIDLLVSDDIDILDFLLEKEINIQIKYAIDSLTTRQKDIIICYYVKNMSISDIADALDISYRTVVNIKTRAIEKLKKILKQQ